MRAAAAALACLLSALAVAGDVADTGDAALPPGLAGLLVPAQVPSGPPGCLRIDLRDPQPLHAGPGPDAPRVGELAFRPWRDAPGECEAAVAVVLRRGEAGGTRVPLFEAGYDEPALAVTAIRGDWYELALDGRAAWLRRAPGWRVAPYPDLLADTLAYATDAWEGELCASPGEACDAEAAEPGAPLRALSFATRDGQAWIEIEFTTPPCGKEPVRPLRRGWLRAHADDGRPTAWFHPRGC